MKKLSAVFIAVFMVLTSFSTVSADTSYEVKHGENEQKSTTENIGVSTEEPVSEDPEAGGFSTFGLYEPGSSHNVVRSGRMTFAGKADVSYLYTNKNFTGSSSYKLQIKNFHGSNQLKVDLYKKGTLWSSKVITYYVNAGSTRYAYPSGLDHEEDYFLRFDSPSNFEGYVQR
ncbi:hypothetical protein [Oceanobacillus jordanicus]|uniref:CBM6 domain-containing protein n=1 Tax=Oceanobacillus jordanicus TaxID=2867266 RepID=A0AAW5B0U3_9BACI|nr:hypothetical protein [Oceanobacillus jordanicus]MCG3418359.1 hypothetical protein [Oceanobacillus jordanicus]